MMNSKKISAWSASWNRLFIKQSSGGLGRKIEEQLLFHMEVMQRRRCFPDSTSKNRAQKADTFRIARLEYATRSKFLRFFPTSE
jgi:hypothetical protein